MFYSGAITKYLIIVFSFQYKRFLKSDFLTETGDQSGRKSRTPPPCMWRKSLAELAVLPGKCALQIGSFLSGLLILHQIIKLDPTNQSQLSWTGRVGSALGSLPGSLLILLKVSSLLASRDISVVILDVPRLENA